MDSECRFKDGRGGFALPFPWKVAKQPESSYLQINRLVGDDFILPFLYESCSVLTFPDGGGLDERNL